MNSEEEIRLNDAAKRAEYLRSTLKSFVGRPEHGPLSILKALIESSTARTLERMGQAPWAQQNQSHNQNPQQVQPQPEQLPNNGGLFSNLRGLFQPPPPPPPLTEEQIQILEEEQKKANAEQDRKKRDFEDRERLKRQRNLSINEQ